MFTNENKLLFVLANLCSYPCAPTTKEKVKVSQTWLATKSPKLGAVGDSEVVISSKVLKPLRDFQLKRTILTSKYSYWRLIVFRQRITFITLSFLSVHDQRHLGDATEYGLEY